MIAKGSAGEVCSQLYAAEDVELLDRETAVRLREEARSLSRRIAALAATLCA
jgi:four helix bundle protein